MEIRLTIAQAAKKLGVEVHAMKNMVYAHEIKCKPVDNVRTLSNDDIAYLAKVIKLLPEYENVQRKHKIIKARILSEEQESSSKDSRVVSLSGDIPQVLLEGIDIKAIIEKQVREKYSFNDLMSIIQKQEQQIKELSKS